MTLTETYLITTIVLVVVSAVLVCAWFVAQCRIHRLIRTLDAYRRLTNQLRAALDQQRLGPTVRNPDAGTLPPWMPGWKVWS